MRSFATMVAAASAYVLLIAVLLGMSATGLAPRTLTAELGETSIVAIEIPVAPAVAADTDGETIS